MMKFISLAGSLGLSLMASAALAQTAPTQVAQGRSTQPLPLSAKACSTPAVERNPHCVSPSAPSFHANNGFGNGGGDGIPGNSNPQGGDTRR